MMSTGGLSPRLRRLVPAVLSLPLALGALTACSASDITAAPTTSADSGAGAGTGADSGGTTGSTKGGGAASSAPAVNPTEAVKPGGGCKATPKAVPGGAARAKSPDLDHDGKKDTLWLVDKGAKRRLGVRTASGATFSTTFSSAAPQAATAIGQQLGDGSSVILLDTGRSVALYTVINCAIVPTLNVQGKQYTFDLGFTGYGTGVRCVDSGRGLQLAGLLAKSTSGGKFAVSQTRIALSNNGQRAANAPKQSLAKAASESSALVKAARRVRCGKKNAGVDEPQS